MRSNIEIEDEQIVEKGDTVWDTVWNGEILLGIWIHRFIDL